MESKTSLIEAILELNAKYSTSSSLEEKTALIHQMVNLIPEDLKSATTQLDIDISDTHKDIKQAIPYSNTQTLLAHLEKLHSLQQLINARALQLRSSLKDTELQKLKAIITNEVIKD